MSTPDVVVIGAGAIGVGCAFELGGAGLRVTVIDRAQPGMEASGASAGMLSAFTLERAGPIGALFRLSRDLYAPLTEALRAESGVDIEHQRNGHLSLCVTEGEVRRAQRLVADRAHAAERLEFVSADDLRRLEPAVTQEASGALYLPRNEWVNSGRLVTALVQASIGRGVRYVLGDPVEEILHADGRVAGVRARGLGRLTTGAVVLAAGAWSSDIRGAPPALRLRSIKGQMIALGNVPPLLHHVVLREEVYLVPRVGGECLVGATVEDGLYDKAVTSAGLHWLLSEALATAPGLAHSRLLGAWAGLRPATPDGLPAIGPWPGVSGLFVATGHFRSGILLTPLTARIIREWIVDGRCTVPADPFLPDRLLP